MDNDTDSLDKKLLKTDDKEWAFLKEELAKLRQELRHPKEYFLHLWEDKSVETWPAPYSDEEDEESPKKLWPTDIIVDGFVLFTAPKKTKDIDDDGNELTVDGVCWVWHKDETWIGNIWESSFDWYADNGPTLPTTLTLRRPENVESDLDDLSGENKREMPLEMREMLDPVFEKAGEKYTKSMRKKMTDISKTRNPKLLLRDAEKSLDEIVTHSKNKKMAMLAVIFACFGFIAYQLFGNHLTTREELLLPAIENAKKSAPNATSADQCIRQALLNARTTNNCNGNIDCQRDIMNNFASVCITELSNRDARLVDDLCPLDFEQYKNNYCDGDMKARDICYCDPLSSNCEQRDDPVRTQFYILENILSCQAGNVQ